MLDEAPRPKETAQVVRAFGYVGLKRPPLDLTTSSHGTQWTEGPWATAAAPENNDC